MSNPNFKISVQEGYVLMERQAGSTVVPGDQPAMQAELLGFCKEANCRNVIITGSDVKVDLSTLDLLELGNEIANSGLRIAVVETHDASADDVSFLENVAWNRGGLIQFFDAEDAALEWLGVA